MKVKVSHPFEEEQNTICGLRAPEINERPAAIKLRLQREGQFDSLLNLHDDSINTKVNAATDTDHAIRDKKQQ